MLRGGWFHSSDIGYFDDSGYVFLVDRTTDMINSAGFKIWPREVEEVLYQHRSVFECAVVACQRRQGRSGRRLRARKATGNACAR